VTGIRPALVASDDVDTLRQDIDNLPFPLISPLATDDDGALTLSRHDLQRVLKA
jgi:hypothetical protein